MKNIILIAPPGAGKGTQAAMLCDKLNMVHISIGDLLRDEVKKETDLGKSLKDIMQTGNLVSDEIIFEVVSRRFKENDINNGVILDGFPRNIKQAEELDKMNIKIDAAIYLNVSKETLLNRILGRVSCPNCKASYNTNSEDMRPKCDNICDHCGTELTKRKDDNIDTFENRYETYMNETYPVLEFYKEKNILYTIDLIDKEEIFNEILKIIESTGPMA